MNIQSPIEDVRGVGPEVAKKLHQLGVRTIADLIQYYPRRYDDYSKVQTVKKLRPGIVTLKAKITHATGRYVRRGMHITEAIATDDTGSTRLIWFNQPYRVTQFKDNEIYFITGDYQLRARRFSILSPSVERVSDFPVNTARIVPIYRETKGLKSTQIRKILREVMPLVDNISEQLPLWLIKKHKLLPFAEALHQVHFPSSSKSFAEAKRRLGFEEVFRLTLAALLNKYELLQAVSITVPFKQDLAKDFVAKLPFALTDDQRKAVWQLYLDMQKTQPANRLIEGDVGSGKTVVATMVALMAIEQGFQVALMAPTEILAKQHAETIHSLMDPMGFGEQVGLLVGSMSTKQKTAAQQAIKNGNMRFIIGTHALIAEKVDMQKLGLVIIDEQHRFGVEERKKLLAKAGHAPHVLMLSATPIPRSIALTLFGDLEISIIRQKPKGRLPIATTLVPPSSRLQIYKKLEHELQTGNQAFIVCPLVNDSAALSAKSATTTYEQLHRQFPKWRIGLLHGQLKTNDKELIMADFLNHKIDVLVSTTVIEVGVDVPNATIMLIESPERFGLAQLHQLRGRIGRNDQPSHCYVMLSDAAKPSRRLQALAQTNDGFALAELDLALRGPGAMYGTLQHGQLDLTFATLSDTYLITEARKSAQQFIDKGENLLQYKELAAAVSRLRAVTNLN